MISLKGNALFMGDQKIEDLVEKYQTPFTLWSESGVEKQVGLLKRGLSSYYQDSTISYVSANNYEQGLLRMLRRLEIIPVATSGRELFVATNSGYEPNQIMMSGLVKNKEDITYAIQNQVHAFCVNSWDELVELSDLAQVENRNVRFILRVNLGKLGWFTDYKDVNRRFGVPLESVSELLQQAKKLNNVEYLGLSSYLVVDRRINRTYQKAIDKLVELIKTLDETGFHTKELGLGGSYLPQKDLDPKLKQAFLLSTKVKSTKGKKEDGGEEDLSPIFEFGKIISERLEKKTKDMTVKPKFVFRIDHRWLKSASAVVARVKAVQNGWVYLNLSQSSTSLKNRGEQHMILLDPKRLDRQKKKQSIAGASCGHGCNFYENKELLELNVGDYLVLPNRGMNRVRSDHYLSASNTPIYLINKENAVGMISRSQEYKDVLKPMEETYKT